MKTFKDAAGRPWAIDMNVATLRRAKNLLGINLVKAMDDDLFTLLQRDVVLLVDILYVVAEPHGEAFKKVSDEEFALAMKGDALDDATTAFIEAMIEFFPPEKSAILTRLYEKMKQAAEKQIGIVGGMIDNGYFEEKLEARMAQAEADLEAKLRSI